MAETLRHLGLKDDHELLERKAVVYDALYVHHRRMVRHGKRYDAIIIASLACDFVSTYLISLYADR
jgi:hypothetical protein